MAYEPTAWECGDVVTAELLNKLEQAVAELSEGGSAEPLTVNRTYDGDTTTLDKTWQEIHDAFPNVRIASSDDPDAYDAVSSVYKVGSSYCVDILYGSVSDAVKYSQFMTSSTDGYPEYTNPIT